jgi:hypothetical protein
MIVIKSVYVDLNYVQKLFNYLIRYVQKVKMRIFEMTMYLDVINEKWKLKKTYHEN